MLVYTFRIARDSGIILWTAKMPFQVALLSIGPVHEKAISRQVRIMLSRRHPLPAQVTVRSLPEWRSKYFYLMMRRGRKIAKVAMALSQYNQNSRYMSLSRSEP